VANELYSLSELFHKKLFRIPDYQRGYAWKHEQLVNFWDDLSNLHEGKHHYTGLLSLKPVDRKSTKTWQGDEWLLDTGYKPFHVVDGQQRLTTFSILMYVIVSFVRGLPENQGKPDMDILLGSVSLKEIEASYIVKRHPPQNLTTTFIFGYEIDNPSNKYLKHEIFDEPSGGEADETYYTKNLKYAKSFFVENLRFVFGNEGIQGIERLYHKLTLRLMFNLHVIEDDYDVFVAFETMNNRGKKLSYLELLKNRLIYLTTLFDDRQFDETDKENLRKNINEAWKEVYRQLGRNKETLLDDDEFLRAHWITYFRYSRKGGNDYIRFLLGKFSAKNIFEKHATIQETESDEALLDYGQNSDDETIDAENEDEAESVGKLAPKEISDYVNNLKDLAKYWYYSFFPFDSEFGKEEKNWLDKLNRVGIGYFRPLVVAALAKEKTTTEEERLGLFRSIERFIFVVFRVGGTRGTYQSSVYYNKSRDVSQDNASLLSIAEELDNTTTNDAVSAIARFIADTDKRFNSGNGFIDWWGLRYFFYEYEGEKATKNNLEKMADRNLLFMRKEKDKISIEHILPQTPTERYWRNAYRMYDKDEIKLLSASLGNLLPLSQSINSSLQNVGFPEKKNPSTRRRGYTNGSHSEIEVAQETDWTAQNILDRGLSLLGFMESQWDISFTDEQKMELLHIGFAKDIRDGGDEIPESDIEPSNDGQAKTLHELRRSRRISFWTKFVEHCQSKGRGEEIASRKPQESDSYFVKTGRRDCEIFFQIFHQKELRIGLWVGRKEDFARLVSRKEDIEKKYGSKLNWDSSRRNSTAKRILHSIDADIHNPNMLQGHFDWLISQFDKLRHALASIDSNRP